MNETHVDETNAAHTRITTLYAQRNFYLCGFTLFLAFVLSRHIALLFRIEGLKKTIEATKQK